MCSGSVEEERRWCVGWQKVPKLQSAALTGCQGCCRSRQLRVTHMHQTARHSAMHNLHWLIPNKL